MCIAFDDFPSRLVRRPLGFFELLWLRNCFIAKPKSIVPKPINVSGTDVLFQSAIRLLTRLEEDVSPANASGQRFSDSL